MTHRKISVIVPTYNQAQYLGACLDSLWFQDYPELEIIVVADPSPDDTAAVLDAFCHAVARETVSFASRVEPDGSISRTTHKRYTAQGRELVLIRPESRLGHTPAYNAGFRAATGEYATYVASDDLCHPHMLSALAAPLDCDKADFVYSDMFIVDDAMRILREFRLPDYSFSAAFEDWYLCGVSKLYRTSLHRQFGYFDPAYVANDHECYLRFAMNGARFLHIPKVLYSVRSHEQRGVDVHSEESMRRLFGESRDLVYQARAFSKQKNME